jgi:hypothetical protein
MAREKAREAREAVRQGIDPVEERKTAKAILIAAQRRGLQTAMSMINKSIAPIEDDMAALLEFLTWALAIEVFLDAEVMNQSFKWDPWRVPLDPQAAFEAKGWSFPIEIQKLNSEELRLVERG